MMRKYYFNSQLYNRRPVQEIRYGTSRMNVANQGMKVMMKQSKVVRQWDMFIQGIDRRERVVKSCSLLCLSACERKIFEEFISGLFHGDPRRRVGTSSVDFVERGPGPPACRAYRASFLPLDWSAPSNWRSRKKKEKKDSRRGSARERERRRKEEAD